MFTLSILGPMRPRHRPPVAAAPLGPAQDHPATPGRGRPARHPDQPEITSKSPRNA